MSVWSLQYVRGGVWLPRLRLWLDPPERQLGPDRVFVSHAHSDHTAAHREVILSEPTARLMQARGVKVRTAHAPGFGETRRFDDAEVPWQITLLPAGHIFGSAMAFVEAGGESLLYTGDFKLRPGLSAEPCAPRRADVLVMETTYGRPQYRFPPTEALLGEAVGFCRATLERGATAVLLGYSLGKSQELLCALADAGLPLMLHDTVRRLTEVYAQLGRTFPAYERFDPSRAAGKVLLCPPQAVRAAGVRNLGAIRVAIFTGWAVERGCRFRYGADAAFALSDHADFPDLVEMVRRVAPRKVYTLHGFAADFAGTLRGLGCDAQSLSEDEQLELALGGAPP